MTQCVRVRIEWGGGGDPIEIALDCRVQITRRHLQIAAFKPHSNGPPFPTREIKLIRTFGQRSGIFISLFLSYRGESLVRGEYILRKRGSR